jgi:hypothetical protein
MNATGQDTRGSTDSGDVPPGISTPSRAPEPGGPLGRRRRPPAMRALAAAGAVAVVAAGVTAALLARSPASDPPSALAALTAALAKTSQGSYSFTLDSTVKSAGMEIRSVVVSGVLDPGQQRGAELLTARAAQPTASTQTAQIRFTGEYVYTWVSPGSGSGPLGKPWNKAPVPGTDLLPASDLYGFVSDWPVSPAELLGLIRSAATARDSGAASGTGWTGTEYAFTARLGARWSLTGIAYVDTQGRVRRLVTTTTPQSGVTTYRDLTFAHFGAPVPVTAPPASQVRSTSRPYWGFYF